MTNKVESFLTKVGHDFKVGFDKIKPFTPLLGLLPGGSIATAVVGSIISVEQKFAAAGAQSGTGTQKLSEVTAIVGPVVADFLGTAGKPADAATVTKYIDDIVDILNVSPATTIPATS